MTVIQAVQSLGWGSKRWITLTPLPPLQWSHIENRHDWERLGPVYKRKVTFQHNPPWKRIVWFCHLTNTLIAWWETHLSSWVSFLRLEEGGFRKLVAAKKVVVALRWDLSRDVLRPPWSPVIFQYQGAANKWQTSSLLPEKCIDKVISIWHDTFCFRRILSLQSETLTMM